MATRKSQHKAGIPEKPRGQQTGFAGNPDQGREEIDKTPALRGRRKQKNKMFGDASEQHVASNPVNPSTNSPSTVAHVGSKKSPQGGERAFKRRMARK